MTQIQLFLCLLRIKLYGIEIPMCRYGMVTYKPHYACFSCRKTFKRKLLADIDRNLAHSDEWVSPPSKCPECGSLMANMGLDFESPKKNDYKAWNHLKNLYQSGITFHSCGCTGPGYIPKDRQKLIEFLNEQKEKFIEHRRFWSNWVPPQTKIEKNQNWNKNGHYLVGMWNRFGSGARKNATIDTDKAINYWTKKINEVQLYLNNLTT